MIYLFLIVTLNQKKTNVSDSNGTKQDLDSISLSYSMGGMTINVVDADCSNCSYTANKSQDERAVTLAIAF